jgi:hypothetical protein
MKRTLVAASVLLMTLTPALLHAGPITGNLLTNPGAETGDLSGWTAGGPGMPMVDNGSFDPGINPHSGNYDFVGYSGASDSLSQTFNIVVQGVTTGLIDSGELTAQVSFWEQGLNQGAQSDDAYIQISFLNGSMGILGTIDTPEIDSHEGQWENYTNNYSIPSGTRYMTYSMEFKRYVGTDLDAFVDDNSLVIDGPSGTTPEPSSFMLMGSGLLGCIGVVRRRRKPYR